MIEIKGKKYMEVSERVKIFRSDKKFEGWQINTMMHKNEDGICIFEARIINTDNIIISNGYAYEKENSTFINKTSYIENCETSAIGRALGFLGIGIDAGIASADEVQNAVINQKSTEKAEPKKQPVKKQTGKRQNILNDIGELIKNYAPDKKEQWAKYILDKVKKNSFQEMTEKELSLAYEFLFLYFKADTLIQSIYENPDLAEQGINQILQGRGIKKDFHSLKSAELKILIADLDDLYKSQKGV